jgi:general secretion pathway protein G
LSEFQNFEAITLLLGTIGFSFFVFTSGSRSKRKFSMTIGQLFQMRKRINRGFTLIEIVLIVAILTIVAQAALASYYEYAERARVSQAIDDIALLSTAINQYQKNTGIFPTDLGVIGYAGKIDPWGHPYVYLNLTSKDTQDTLRRDHNSRPVNSDFDLYSLGKDGVSKKQITSRDSSDDVIRAHDGAFINLASQYVTPKK